MDTLQLIQTMRLTLVTFRLHYGTDDLVVYFENRLADKSKPLPNFDELRCLARALNTRFATSQAARDARDGNVTRHRWHQGTPWTPPIEQTSSSASVEEDTGSNAPSKGDCVLAQSILFMRDAILSKLAAEAVARGDIGTVYEALKVRIVSVICELVALLNTHP